MIRPRRSQDDRVQSPHSDRTTEGIRVRAAAQYLPDESENTGSYIYGYRIVIENTGSERARLLTRHWIILDADGNRNDVRGTGVVGKHPDLGPGESFSYESYCPLPSPWGTMEGSYLMQRENGERFRAEIGRFFLVPQGSLLELDAE